MLEAVIWAASVQGRYAVNIGTRGLAERAGCSYETVAKGLHALAELGLVSRVARGEGPGADVWLLHVGLGAGHRATKRRFLGLRPVFRVLGGRLVGEVYESLREAAGLARGAGELAAELGYGTSAVHEALALLAGWGLAVRGAGGWLRGPADPQELGERLGGEGHLEEQRARHRAQRRRWRERLAEWEARRAPVPGPEQYRLWEWEVAQALPRDEAWLRDLASGVPPPAVATTGA